MQLIMRTVPDVNCLITNALQIDRPFFSVCFGLQKPKSMKKPETGRGVQVFV